MGRVFNYLKQINLQVFNIKPNFIYLFCIGKFESGKRLRNLHLSTNVQFKTTVQNLSLVLIC